MMRPASSVLVPTLRRSRGSCLLVSLRPDRNKSTPRRRPPRTSGCFLHSSSYLDNNNTQSNEKIATSPSNTNPPPLTNNDAIRQQKHEQLVAASRLSLAPMMDYTDRHFRHLVRLVSNRTLLYTEMVAANALAHERNDLLRLDGPRDDSQLRRYLSQGQTPEGPCVLQLGGSDPEQLYEAARAVLDLSRQGVCDYTALNLNCGCPSPKVAGKGCFGAALMDQDPRTVAALARALHDGCDGRLPITIKCRIGTDTPKATAATTERPSQSRLYHDDDESQYKSLCHFIETIAADGIVSDFAIHARIAVLTKSFSPAKNRNVPPLKYHLVRRLVQQYSPQLTFSLNGGIQTIAQVQDEFAACPGLHGVMIGRAWAADPWSFAMADQLIYGDQTVSKKSLIRNRWHILEQYGRHADHEENIWGAAKIRRFITQAIAFLFTGERNAKRFRLALDDLVKQAKTKPSQGGDPPLSKLILSVATQHLSEETLYRTPEESYERFLWESKKSEQQQILRTSLSDFQGTASVSEWQNERKRSVVWYNKNQDSDEPLPSEVSLSA